MLLVTSIIYGTSKGVENASVDMFPLCLYQSLIHGFGITTVEIANPMDADIIEQPGNSRTNAWNG